jgi:pilus assembly protein CpaE
MLATLDRTDLLVLVCGLDVPSIKNVRLSLQTLELLSFPPSRVRVLLNRANSQVGLKRAEVEAALEVKIAYEVPSDRAVPLSVNRGAPAVVSEAQSEYARAMRQVAESLLPATPDAQRRRWLPALARS